MIRWQPTRPANWWAKLTVGLLGKIGISAIIASAMIKVAPAFVYNATPSVALGLYRVLPTGQLKVGDLVLLHTPPTVRELADARRYLPRTVPMIKHVAALDGDTVCARGRTIFINGEWAAERQSLDSSGRVLPVWEGCRTLSVSDMFLLNEAPNSFDSRYFGIVDRSLVIGQLQPL